MVKVRQIIDGQLEMGQVNSPKPKGAYGPVLCLALVSGALPIGSAIATQEPGQSESPSADLPLVDPGLTVHTSAKYLLTPVATAPQSAGLSVSTIPNVESPTPQQVATPQFSSLRTSPSAVLTSLSTDATPMNLPAPAPAADRALPPAAAVVEVAPAPNPVPFKVSPNLLTPSEIAADESVPPGYSSVFIDPTDYSIGATEVPGLPSLVFSDRSSGCQITVEGGQFNQGCGLQAQGPGAEMATGGIQLGPVHLGSHGLSIGNTTVVSREFINEKLRPLNVLRRGTEEYVFPLSIPAPITSLFGWRVHPVWGDHRFHSGTDLAAPMGTPVLATRAGRVAVADYLGGYGLTVILRHGEEGNLESRYAHMSQVLVRSGEWVEQGEVVGLVGNTGTSTGPHLHFEMRQLTAQGWAAVDARDILKYGVANLMEVLNNPLHALGHGADGEAPDGLSGDLPYRPAQPNAS